MIHIRRGSIESVTGWPGAHTDDPPSNVRATTPGAKLKTGNSPDRFDVLEGVPMLRIKSGPALKFASELPVEFKADGSGRISGYGSVFGVIDTYGEKVAPGAFSKSLRALTARGAMPKMLWQHHHDQPIGKWLVAKEDSKGLFVDGQLNLKTTTGRDAYEHLAAGDIDGLSIGYREVKARSEGDARVLDELDLYEVSPVTFQALRVATVETVKAVSSKSELVDLLRGAGLPKAAAVRVAAGGWPAIAGADHQQATALADIIDAATAKFRSL